MDYLDVDLEGTADLISSGIDSGTEYAFNEGGQDFISQMFSTAGDYAGNAFQWLEDHPESANLIGGVAMGVGQAYTAAQDRKAQRQMQRERLDAQKIAPGDMPGGYGGYRDNISEGLISNGLIARQQGGK